MGVRKSVQQKTAADMHKNLEKEINTL